MTTAKQVTSQLKKLGFSKSFFYRAEIDELPRILMPDEQICQLAAGWYNGGTALLCATNQRVLLIDKKLFSLVLEDVRYDMIAEVMYKYRLIDTTLVLTYAAKTLQFKCWNQDKLRQLASFIQERVMEKKEQQIEQLEVAEQTPTPLLVSGGTTAFEEPLTTQQTRLNVEPSLPLNPYQTKLPFRRRKASRFITSSQMGSN